MKSWGAENKDRIPGAKEPSLPGAQDTFKAGV